MQNLPPRESSPSPFRERPRTIKASSMPMVPSVAQAYATQSLQSSPTSSNPSRRSPPYQPQVQRLLPTPPHPNPPNLPEHSPERHMSPPPSQLPSNVATHYPRPIPRVPPPQFLTKFEMEEPWQMTEELLADIERADLQQSQGQPVPAHTFSGGYAKSESPAAKDPAVERVRGSDKSSPKAIDSGQLGRRHSLRDSPKSRDRPTASPKTSSFSPTQIQSPDRRNSPSYTGGLPSPGEQSQPRHESPPVLRRAVNGHSNLATQTPPLQAISARTPDRSLPVQEEPEEEVGVPPKKQESRDDDQYRQDRSRDYHGSPLPSSDVHPEGRSVPYDVSRTHGGRNSRSGHRDDDHTLVEDNGKRSTDEGGFTPRSSSVNLPDQIQVEERQPAQPNAGNNGAQTIRASRKSRNSASDQLGLKGLDTALFDQPERGRSGQPPQYSEPQKQQQNINDAYAQLYAQQLHADEIQSIMEHPTSSYIQAYLRSPRPDAPIPPTPHSQTSPPSPSPLLSGAFHTSKDLPPFSPIAPAGSPYPYPFSHVRRNQVQSQAARHAMNMEINNPAAIHEQFVKQWQIYAQNNHGNITDSTLSPSSTPFPTPPYNPWAYWHTQRILGGRFPDTATQRSSPSHEPIDLPAPPPQIGLRKKVHSVNLRARSTIRKPPPRVDSTQPRDTSPEPSTSGEETAGEEHYAVTEEGSWVNGNAPAVTHTLQEDDDSEWVDEDWDDDEDDLLELEYHPSFVNNIEKRRRRFETRWDALMQAFQALDRQTDATMVLLAAPSHSTKLHMATSRSVRRQTTISRSASLATIRTGFRQVAAQRRSLRSHKASLADRFLISSSASGDASDGSSESREEDLKRALEAALGSLGVLGNMYEQREARWMDEMRRISEDRERVELLLRQALGARS
ncbi:hypothetical protein Moror_2787 [Moniliophthora roreri MCA 2997]|uniref:Uncharacterized protein n=3 Tax=Moniliophthora roreri TaxID=221103 RepID=V2YHZ9_MONRO|nr:hypothetical protein Moror_2787 [Moniliophthora roreri MCA 2997]